jgi:hypothetical protein
VERQYGYIMRTRGGESFRCYYETVPSEMIGHAEERARIASLERSGYTAVMFYSAGADDALGGLAKDYGTTLTEAEFVAAREAGWPDSRPAPRTHTIAVGGSLDARGEADS